MDIQNTDSNFAEGHDDQANERARTPTTVEWVNYEIDVLSRQISIATLDSVTDPRPKTASTSVKDFIDQFRIPDKNRKTKEGPTFMQGSVANGGSRSDIRAFEMIVFDIDDGDDPEKVRENLEKSRLVFIIYPTFNDGKEVDGKRLRKYRVIVFLDRAISREELGASGEEQKATWKAIRRLVAERLKLKDDPCDDLPRNFYKHRRPEGAVSWFFCTEHGGALCADGLLLLATARLAAEKTNRAQRRKLTSKKGGRNPSAERRKVEVFCKKNRKRMNVEQLVEDCIPDSRRKDVGIEAECPNRFGTEDLGDGRSSSGHGDEEGGRKLFAVNAEHSDCGTAAIMCQHGTCTDDLSFADFVWLIMQEGRLTAEDLRAYVRKLADDEFEYNGDKLKASRHNFRVALNKLGVTLRWNEFTNTVEQDGLDRYPTNLIDPAVTDLHEAIQEAFELRFAVSRFEKLIDDEAHRNKYHPLRDELNELKDAWDGVNRVDDFLIRYFGAEDTPLNRWFGRLVLIAAVRRIMKPGCKFDQILILISDQGLGKSTGLRIMAMKDEWFTDNLPIGVDAKEVIEQASGHWIVEFAELADMGKRDIGKTKAFASRTVDKARMSYGRRRMDVPRQFICIGTTNDEKFLKDRTGNRRFWPVKCGKVDRVALEAEIQQVWAEAVVLEAQGESIELPPEFYEDAAKLQQAHMIDDQYVDTLQLILGNATGKIPATYVYEMLGLAPEKQQQYTTEAIGRAMKELGWDKKSLRYQGNKVMCFVRGETKGECAQEIATRIDGNKRELVPLPSQPEPAANDDNPYLDMLSDRADDNTAKHD